jgi:hypothetical protein
VHRIGHTSNIDPFLLYQLYATLGSDPASVDPVTGMPLDDTYGRDGRRVDPSQDAMVAAYQQMMAELLELLVMWVMSNQAQSQNHGRNLGSMPSGGFSGSPQRASWGPQSGGSQSGGAPGPVGQVNPNVGATPGVEGAEKWRAMAEEYGRAYGVPADYILALIKTESNGNPQAIGDNGHSVGLFQLHDQGVGHGLSVEQRMDPRVQFEKMMPRIKAAYDSGRAQGLDGAQLAIHIAREAERPAEYTLPKYGDSYNAIVSARA